MTKEEAREKTIKEYNGSLEQFAIDNFLAGYQCAQEWISLESGCEMPSYDDPVLWCDVSGNQFVSDLDKDGNEWLEYCTHWKRLGPLPPEPTDYDERLEYKRKEVAYENWINKKFGNED